VPASPIRRRRLPLLATVAIRVPNRIDISPISREIEKLFARGFPTSANRIDYESLNIPTRGFMTECYDVEEDSTATHVCLCKYAPHKQISSLDGMSGSPVIAMTRNQEVKLVGLVVRAGDSALRFIDARVIKYALQQLPKEST